MLTPDKQSQKLNKIIGVEDLDNENAAVVSGGVVVADSNNLGGAKAVFNGPVNSVLRSMQSFNNRITSIGIPPAQVWAFWTGQNRTGTRKIYGPGFYNIEGSLNNNFESAQRLQ